MNANGRTGAKLDFSVNKDEILQRREKGGAITTANSVAAAQEVGFVKSAPAPKLIPPLTGSSPEPKLDGRRLRKKLKTQMNLKVTPEEKRRIIEAAMPFVENRIDGIETLGDYVVRAVEYFQKNGVTLISK